MIKLLKIGGVGLLWIVTLYALTPVFYFVGHIAVYVVVSFFDFVVFVFSVLVKNVSYLSASCKNLIATCLPTLPDYMSSWEGGKVIVGMFVIFSLLACLKLRLGGKDE